MDPNFEEVKSIFKDAFNLYVSCHKMDDTDQNWEKVIREVDKINKNHNSQFCTDMFVAVLKQANVEKKHD